VGRASALDLCPGAKVSREERGRARTSAPARERGSIEYILNVLVSFKQPVGDELSPFHRTQPFFLLPFFLLPFTINATLSGVWFVCNKHLIDGQTSRSSRYVWATQCSLAPSSLSLSSLRLSHSRSVSHSPHPCYRCHAKKRIINTKKPPAPLVPFTDTAEPPKLLCHNPCLTSPTPLGPALALPGPPASFSLC
jgi:hypothetical protein